MIDALEMQVLVLRDLAEVAEYAQEPPPSACTLCWQLVETCVCPPNAGVYWPVGEVALRLDSHIRAKKRALTSDGVL